jgi:hypothetical protein
MPAYTLGEIMSQATFMAGRRADLAASQVSYFANEAYMEVAEVAHHSLLEEYMHTSTASGQARYPLPAGFGTPIVVALSSTTTSSIGTALCDWPSDTTLRMLSPAQFQVSTSTAYGMPTGYCIFGDELGLQPTPDDTYPLALRYKVMVSDLTDSAAIPSMSTPWRRAVLLKTVEHIYAALGDAQGESTAGQRYMGYVSQLQTDHAKRQTASSTGLAGVHVYQHPNGA